MEASVVSETGLYVRGLCLRVRGGERDCGGGLGVVDGLCVVGYAGLGLLGVVVMGAGVV